MNVDERMALDELAVLGASSVYSAAMGHARTTEGLAAVCAGSRTAGPALTVRCAPGDVFAVYQALEVAEPGDILVVAANGEHLAFWGGLITTAAIERGVAGAVVDGAVRDTAEIVQARFPVWARGVTPATPRRELGGAVGVEVEVGGVRIGHRDVVVADDDGVVVIPAVRLLEIRHTAVHRHRRELASSAGIRLGHVHALDLAAPYPPVDPMSSPEQIS